MRNYNFGLNFSNTLYFIISFKNTNYSCKITILKHLKPKIFFFFFWNSKPILPRARHIYIQNFRAI
jgi:nicotinamide riboside transporter PnuC